VENSKPMKSDSIFLWAVTIAIFTLLVGCASPSQPTRFYRLDGGDISAEMVDLTPRLGIVKIGVTPVELAGYLDRPQIVERRSGYQIELYEFDQWAGSLQENLLRVVSDQLQQQLKTMQVITYPWQQSINPDYELNLSVSRFDRVADQVVLQARWNLLERRNNQVVEMQQMTLQEPFSGGSIEAGIKAASQVVSRLSEYMAMQILKSVTDSRKDN
jgi:uncharacterized protein